MKLKLKNIGTLKQAEIDLSKDLIILAGPNNTGKTYAAYTVYGVCDSLKKEEEIIPLDNNIGNFIHKYELFSEDKEDLNIDIIDFIQPILSSITSTINYEFQQKLGNVFATNDEMFKKSDVGILIDEKEVKEYFIRLGFDSSHLTKTPIFRYLELLKKSNHNLITIKAPKQFIGKKISFSEWQIILNWIFDYLYFEVINFYYNNLYISTAERSAINIFSKELSIKRNNIVDQLLELRDSRNGDANQLLGKLQRYPLPIRDSLAISEDLANLSRNKSEYGFLADRIEDVLLDGKITTSKEGEVQYSPNNSKVKNLSIHLTASIVKSLSNLVFYFRHIAQKGDFIIIDEPELNLHPDNQRKVARLFGEIINQGFKVMISTHSDYIIRELNNLIMLKSGGEKAEYLAGKYGYEEKQLIDYQRVGAYLFNHNKNISLEVTEIGFEVGTIDAVINELNNASEEIYFTLFD